MIQIPHPILNAIVADYGDVTGVVADAVVGAVAVVIIDFDVSTISIDVAAPKKKRNEIRNND